MDDCSRSAVETMDNDLETLLNETLEEFPEKDIENQEFLKQFSQNIQIQESVKETIDSIRSEKAQPEENIDDLLDNLNSLMDNGELDSLLSGVMDQIVSKDLLYEPMKDLASKYPEFLLKSKNNIDQEEYKRYEEQFRIVKEIISIYDTGNDSVKVLQLMQDMQETGNPPAEILQDLAPGLDLSKDFDPSMLAANENCAMQ